jgi:hypothetical protein
MCDISHTIHVECDSTHVTKIGVIFNQLKIIGCDILNVHLAYVRYYTSINMQSVIF